MIELENLSKTYAKKATKKGAKAAKPAVDSLSLEIRSGEIFGFLGPNGAGKTTTIKMLTGVLKPDSGRVRIDGIELARLPLEAKARFGYVGDNPELWNRLKAAEFLNFMADVYGVGDEERGGRIERYARRFAIADALGAPIASYSRGMKQKLCIVASLVHEPSNWILDEPLVGLDPEAAFELKALMRERTAAGASVFFSTHVMEVAEKLCDRIGVISGGKLVFVGSLEELRERRAAANGGEAIPSDGGDESLERLFLDLVEEERESEAKA
jgi:ABC-2 type transport system ATP-binding protein